MNVTYTDPEMSDNCYIANPDLIVEVVEVGTRRFDVKVRDDEAQESDGIWTVESVGWDELWLSGLDDESKPSGVSDFTRDYVAQWDKPGWFDPWGDGSKYRYFPGSDVWQMFHFGAIWHPPFEYMGTPARG